MHNTAQQVLTAGESTHSISLTTNFSSLCQSVPNQAIVLFSPDEDI
ncbi:MAG: hypothetical protein PUP93_24525 [Rhizonema sp. NSF051]|nr:hypothetical protein [Rhizonema sp. NSF051]